MTNMHNVLFAIWMHTYGPNTPDIRRITALTKQKQANGRLDMLLMSLGNKLERIGLRARSCTLQFCMMTSRFPLMFLEYAHLKLESRDAGGWQVHDWYFGESMTMP